MTACVPRPGGFDLRLLNASARAVEARITLTPRPAEVMAVSLGGQPEAALPLEGGRVRLRLRGWQIATLRVRRDERS